MFANCFSLEFEWYQVSSSLQVFWSILAMLEEFWMVFTRPLISKSSNPRINSLVTVPRAPIKIGITITFMFHSFFNSQTRSLYLSFFSFSFDFTLWSARNGKVHNFASSLFLIDYYLVVWPRLDYLFVSQDPWEVYVSHSLGQIPGCACTICLYGRI